MEIDLSTFNRKSITNYAHLHKNEGQLRSWFNTKLRQNKVGNLDFTGFLDWYNQNEKVCHYCGLTEIESQQLVRLECVSSKRFPQDGQHGRGTSRGMWLEVDRYDPNGIYDIGNIVLCCYFCNNDKSDIFHGDHYKKFIKDRVGFLKKLIS